MSLVNLHDTVPGAPNFKYAELIASATARARGINNAPTERRIWDNLERVTRVAQKARSHFGVALNITSGFRSSALNTAVGGSTTSHHSQGHALDIQIGSRNPDGVTIVELFTFLHEHGIYTELLLEEICMGGGWVHLAVAPGRESENVIGYKLRGRPVVSSRNTPGLAFEAVMKAVGAA